MERRTILKCVKGWLLSTALLGSLSYSGPLCAMPATVTIGEAAGVQIKEWWTKPEDLDAIKAAGFSTVRFVIPWPTVEVKKGSYDYSKFDVVMRQLAERNMHAVIVLAGGNQNYAAIVDNPDNPMLPSKKVPESPATPNAIKGFIEYAKATVARYRDNKVTWEIWNEPDLKFFWHPAVDVAAYVRLASATCEAIRSVDANARIIGPAAADFPNERDPTQPRLFEAFLQSPSLNCFDAVSLHAYRGGHKIPESISDNFLEFQDYIRRHKPGKVLPIIISEWGYSTSRIPSELQAAYMLRALIINMLNGVSSSIWYEWRNSRNNGTEDYESNFGLRTFNNAEKPGWAALRPVFSQLRDAKVVSKLDTGSRTAYTVLIKYFDGTPFLLAWTAKEGQGARETLSLRESGAVRNIALTPMPQLISITSERPLLRAMP